MDKSDKVLRTITVVGIVIMKFMLVVGGLFVVYGAMILLYQLHNPNFAPDETSSFWETLLEGLFIFGLSYFTIKNIKVE